jgi:hypothetical protein
MLLANFGQSVPAFQRMPFNRPRPANPNLMPHLLRTRWATHLHPFETALPSAGAFKPQLPGASGYMRPGVIPGPAMQGRRRRAAPAAAAVAGHLGAGPYTAMATGMDIPFAQTYPNIRAGVTLAPNLIQRVHSPGFPFASVPAGYYRADTAY